MCTYTRILSYEGKGGGDVDEPREVACSLPADVKNTPTPYDLSPGYFETYLGVKVTVAFGASWLLFLSSPV